jgi:gamma-glutamylcyclotransferase (GGCT)/AIG2-like uncharacterized protein YtfP
LYYFAYGSNMDWPQMQRRCPSAIFVSLGRLPGYRFAIARHSRLRGCGTANILPAPGGEVWGVIYDVAAEDLLLLDRFEDGYRREQVSVAASNGTGPLAALVYIAAREATPPLPNPEYKRHLIDGARHWQLPQRYCEMLEMIETAPWPNSAALSRQS